MDSLLKSNLGFLWAVARYIGPGLVPLLLKNQNLKTYPRAETPRRRDVLLKKYWIGSPAKSGKPEFVPASPVKSETNQGLIAFSHEVRPNLWFWSSLGLCVSTGCIGFGYFGADIDSNHG